MWLANLLEAFPGRFPTEVLAELDRLPIGFLDDVIEVKAYRQAKAMVEAATTAEARKRLPKGPLIELVDEIEMELAEEEIAANETEGNNGR